MLPRGAALPGPRGGMETGPRGGALLGPCGCPPWSAERSITVTIKCEIAKDVRKRMWSADEPGVGSGEEYVSTRLRGVGGGDGNAD
jgi:hypothetical protein